MTVHEPAFDEHGSLRQIIRDKQDRGDSSVLMSVADVAELLAEIDHLRREWLNLEQRLHAYKSGEIV